MAVKNTFYSLMRLWKTRLFKAQSFQSVIQFWNILKFCLQSKASETVRILVSLEAIFSRSAVWSGSLGRFNVYSIAEVAVAFKPRIYFLSEPKTPTPSKVINNSIHYDKKKSKTGRDTRKSVNLSSPFSVHKNDCQSLICT